MTSIELRIPPPVVTLLVGVGMWWIAPRLGTIAMPQQMRVAAAILVVLIGLTIMGAGAIAFWRARTTVNPMRPDQATALVTTGIYRWTRNPMYLADVVLLLAWALYLSSAWSLAGLLVFVAYMNHFQIAAEERTLAELFGADFAAYKSRVRRWI